MKQDKVLEICLQMEELLHKMECAVLGIESEEGENGK